LPPDRRQPIGWRWPAAIIAVVSAALASGAVYYHRTITPPDCNDPRTLALVHGSLVDHFKLPETTSLMRIETVAGGYLAFRYVCKARLTGFDRDALPPGSTVPGTVSYVSRLTDGGHLTDGGRRHEVTVRIAPLMILEQVE
jgi:hypothetical protein